MTAPPEVADPARWVDDAALIEQSRADPDRFASIYDRHFHAIYRYIAGRLGAQAADDLSAETFVTAFGKRERFDPARGAVRPWLFGIATNLVAQHRRDEIRRYRAMERVPAEHVHHDHDDAIDARVAAAGRQGELARELARLSRGDRDVLLLVALGDLSYEEVAQAMGIPFGTVGSRLNRVRKKLRLALGGS
ncbi:RNA polymerase sigma factor [Rhizohabitans arisaemae]|uniref:RNA polymerase sigma factor n=1 Tax=Rhizohabitans arisaemae TaxID=2720610 RepID=UPI0024B24201|nr:RNA polymerase sigma factor [Rhizohabitans arisaemae]